MPCACGVSQSAARMRVLGPGGGPFAHRGASRRRPTTARRAHPLFLLDADGLPVDPACPRPAAKAAAKAAPAASRDEAASAAGRDEAAADPADPAGKPRRTRRVPLSAAPRWLGIVRADAAPRR